MKLKKIKLLQKKMNKKQKSKEKGLKLKYQ